MKFTIPIAMCDPSHYVPLAEVADACGYHAVAVPDGVFYPEQVHAKYPYTFDGSRFWEPDTPFLEPWVVIPAMAARTERLFFYTYVLKLPIRHPLLVARTVQSAAVLSNNRVGLGVGTSWIPEEAEWLGTDFSTRGPRTNEAIEIIRKVLAGGWVEHEGKYYRFGRLKIAPPPSAPVPIIVGGHSKAALRRAARLGDGWCSANCTEADLKGLLDQLRELL
ncbi:MAG: TIGR03619 family F420-dependent LLM class oxidoreductase, partial [Candidatus Dadabacteria bacterium]